MSRDAVRRVARTFLFAFVGLLLPGLLGWLNALTEWAGAEGQRPFPDATSLAYLAVSAIVAGVIAVVNLLVVGVEDLTGHGLLRDVPPPQHRRDTGEAVPLWGVIALVLLAVVVAVLLL
jgi:uncharacterized membrane protein YidH (DUF202 family)